MNSRKDQSYGQEGLSLADRFGVWLSQRAIRRHLPGRNNLEVVELGCGYRAAQLIAPDTDFGWLTEIEKDMALVMVPRSKADRLVLTERLVEAGRAGLPGLRHFA